MNTNTRSVRTVIKNFFKNKTTTIFLIFLGMCLLLGLANNSFFMYENLASVARAVAYTAIFSFGELLVILVGCIDLSIGSVCGLGAVTCCLMITKFGLPVGIAIIFALMAGAIIGAVNAFLVVKVKLPPFVATMGMTKVINSLALLLTNSKPVMGVGEKFINLSASSFLKVPTPLWIMILVAIALSLFLNKCVTGRRLYALGGNEEAARFSGVHTNRLKASVYIISGCLAALSGVLIAAKLGSAQGNTGFGYESDAIASTIIGGASFTGGEGGVFGTIVGACIMSLIRNGLVLLNVSTYWQSMIIGSIIIVAVAIDQFRRASAEKVQKAFINEALEQRKNSN